jgi:hypothetical protein
LINLNPIAMVCGEYCIVERNIASIRGHTFHGCVAAGRYRDTVGPAGQNTFQRASSRLGASSWTQGSGSISIEEALGCKQ